MGESGCGKTVTARSIVDLLPKPAGRVLGGSIRFMDRELRDADPEVMYDVRGNDVGVVFQETIADLNPVQRLGRQIIESLLLHRDFTKAEALRKAVELLDAVGIPSPDRRFPIILINSRRHAPKGDDSDRPVLRPGLLIADEPTTALDVTVQAQILELMSEMQKERGMATLLITHDLGVIAEQCDEVVVMYAGRIVERASVKELFAEPKHAYTKGLLSSIPRLTNERKSKLRTISGQVASIQDFVAGCRFCQRMGRTGDTLIKRPAYEDLGGARFLETCPECT